MHLLSLPLLILFATTSALSACLTSRWTGTCGCLGPRSLESAKRREVRLTINIYGLLCPRAFTQDVRIIEEILLLLYEAGWLFIGCRFRFGFDGFKARVHLMSLAFLEVSQQVLIDLVLILDEERRVELLICPIEVVVQFQ